MADIGANKTGSYRRLRRDHLTLYRGHLEGIDLKTLANLYLETGADAAAARATIVWIRSELVAMARRQDKFSMARLLRVPLDRLSKPAASKPMSLEDFQAERDPHGYYSERELIAIFEKEIGTDRKAAQSNRLRQKALDALRWLEQSAITEPESVDNLDAWIDESVATKLARAGIHTIGDLQALIARFGARWHTKIPKIGVVCAKRIQEWMANSGFLATSLVPVGQNAPLRPLEFAVVPLESLLLPEELSGVDGRNRGNSTTLAANNDLAAINAWLANFVDHAHTIRSYRKEAERFLLWSLFEVGKPISSLSTEDCQGYQRFLGDVGKAVDPWPWRTQESQWVGRKAPRWSLAWRPFAGPLAAPSRALSVSVVKALLEWLTEQNYLRANPWRGIKPPADATPKIRANHSLTIEQWQAVMAMCDKMERSEAYYRLRFILLCGYWTGFRLSELAAMTISDGDSPGFRRAPDGDGYDIEVVGKRNKLRSVPMAEDALLALMDYLECRGFGRNPGEWLPGTPLIATLGSDVQWSQVPGVKVSAATLYRVLKEHFIRVSRGMDTLWDVDHLARASTHWLRHTHATHALQAGAEIYAVQENLGHASVATTAIYSHAGHKVRKAAIEKMRGLSRGG